MDIYINFNWSVSPQLSSWYWSWCSRANTCYWSEIDRVAVWSTTRLQVQKPTEDTPQSNPYMVHRQLNKHHWGQLRSKNDVENLCLHQLVTSLLSSNSDVLRSQPLSSVTAIECPHPICIPSMLTPYPALSCLKHMTNMLHHQEY